MTSSAATREEKYGATAELLSVVEALIMGTGACQQDVGAGAPDPNVFLSLVQCAKLYGFVERLQVKDIDTLPVDSGGLPMATSPQALKQEHEFWKAKRKSLVGRANGALDRLEIIKSQLSDLHASDFAKSCHVLSAGPECGTYVAGDIICNPNM